jgi:hypothetical protein
MTGSGAFAVEIGPIDEKTRSSIVPLPPTGNSGAVKFNPVFLSLAANFATVDGRTVQVTLYREPGAQVTVNLTFPVNPDPGALNGGRTGVGVALTPADRAALVKATGLTVPADQLTALVEYGTP